jgi:hypothetical protein
MIPRQRKRVRVACGKIRFPTLVKARYRAILDTKRFRQKFYIYRCRGCGAWHMTTSPQGTSIEVVPHWSPQDLGPGPGRGWQPTWILLILRWFHATMAGLGRVDEFFKLRATERMLRKRGVL